MPQETLLTIFGIVTSLLAGVNLFQFFSFKSQIQKERALAGQETGRSKQENAKGTQEEVTALNNFADVYDKISGQFGKQFDKMQKTIEELELKLDEYVKQCSQCSNNKIGRK